MLVFYHLLALVKRRVSRPCSAALLQHVLLPLQGFCQAVSNISIHGLLCSFSNSVSSSTSHFRLANWNTRIPTTVPRTLTLFKSDPKMSFLVNKQIRNLFSARRTLSAFQVPLHTLFWLPHRLFFLLPCQNTPTNPERSPINQCFTITCPGHILRDAAATMKTNSLGAEEEGEKERGQKRHSYCAIVPPSLFNCN